MNRILVWIVTVQVTHLFTGGAFDLLQLRRDAIRHAEVRGRVGNDGSTN